MSLGLVNEERIGRIARLLDERDWELLILYGDALDDGAKALPGGGGLRT